MQCTLPHLSPYYYKMPTNVYTTLELYGTGVTRRSPGRCHRSQNRCGNIDKNSQIGRPQAGRRWKEKATNLCTARNGGAARGGDAPQEWNVRALDICRKKEDTVLYISTVAEE